MRDRLSCFVGKKRYFLLAVVFIGVMISAYLFLPQVAVDEISKEFIKGKQSLFNEQMQLSAWRLLRNNLFAAAMAMVTGLIPFLYLPILSDFINGFIVGVIIRMASGSVWGAIKLFAVGILPHGIFEIPALIFSMGIGLTLCHNMVKAIFRKEHYPIRKLITSAGYLYLTVILPLLILAALIETYLTPKLILWGTPF